jgi:hypothetical protein
MTTNRFEDDLNLAELDEENLEPNITDIQDLLAVKEELGNVEVEIDEEEFDLSDFDDQKPETEEHDQEVKEEPKDEKIEIVESESETPEEEIIVPPVEEKPEESEEPDKTDFDAVFKEAVKELLPKTPLPRLSAPTAPSKKVIPTAVKTVKPVQKPANQTRFPTLMLYVPESIETWFHNNESEDVDNYLKKKLQQAAGSRTVKVGPTKVRLNDPNTGDFVWTLKGKIYPQVATFNATENRWELAQH